MAPPANVVITCAPRLERHSLATILSLAERRLPSVAPASPTPDATQPLMMTLEPPTEGEVGLRRELATARAYASFIARARGETFVYASRYQNAFVPVFDGFVRAGDHAHLKNVSLKFDALKRTVVSDRVLLKSLAARLDLTRARRTYTSLGRWLSAVNTWPAAVHEVQAVRALDFDLARALTLWKTFDLNRDEGPPPLTTVVDLSASGFTFDFVNRVEIARAIRAISTPGSLTLLWDHARVLEF